MAYFADVKGEKGKTLFVMINGVKTFVPDTSSYPKSGKYAYSYRTGRRDRNSVLQLGENKMPASLKSAGGLVSYLDAEQTALRELNSELEQSSVLGEGTWGIKDAGHVFSTFTQHTSYGEYLYDRGSPIQSGNSFALLSPYVDSITYDILSRSRFFWPDKDVRLSPRLSPVGVSKSDLMSECAALVLDSSPDMHRGSIGETLVDLVRLPKLLLHARDLGSKFSDLQKSWDRLSESVKRDVNKAFKDPGSASLRLTGKSADAYLAWSFALKPLISDIQLLLEVAARLSGSISESTKRVRKTSEKRIFEDNSTVCPAIVPLYDASQYAYGSGIWPSKVSSSYVVSYDVLIHSKWRRMVSHDNGFLAQANVLNQQLGVIYPSLLWDLVPWSFVIDWFLHLGDAIDRANVLSNGDYQLDYSWATVKGNSGVFIDGVTPLYTSPEKIHFSGVRPATSTFLSRFPVDPRSGLKPKWSSLSGGQQLLAAALGFSRLK